MKSNMVIFPCFLVLLFLASISHTAAASYEPPFPGYWQEVAVARTDPDFIELARFAVRVSKVPGLVLVRVLEGQIWSTSLYGAPTTRRFLIEAVGATNLHKVYEGVVTTVWGMKDDSDAALSAVGPSTLRSFDAVLD